MATAKKSTKKKIGTKKATKKPVIKPETHGTCFVMMPFKEPFGLYYDTIFKPAIIQAKLDPKLANDLFRPSPIVSDLWQMIQEAKVLLAELTTKNANVFYELGLAHAIGKPVILVSETMDDVPFDLQQLRVLLYDKNDPTWGDKLSKGITNAITETLDNPIDTVPSIFRKTVASQAPEQDATRARLDRLESQIRGLRAQESRQPRYNNPWEKALQDVNQPSELDEWKKRWLKIVPVHILKRAIERAENIPSEEAERFERESKE